MQYKIIMQLETACYFIHFRIPIKFINRNKKVRLLLLLYNNQYSLSIGFQQT
jgi:hypothetical protein